MAKILLQAPTGFGSWSLHSWTIEAPVVALHLWASDADKASNVCIHAALMITLGRDLTAQERSEMPLGTQYDPATRKLWRWEEKGQYVGNRELDMNSFDVELALDEDPLVTADLGPRNARTIYTTFELLSPGHTDLFGTGSWMDLITLRVPENGTIQKTVRLTQFATDADCLPFNKEVRVGGYQRGGKIRGQSLLQFKRRLFPAELQPVAKSKARALDFGQAETWIIPDALRSQNNEWVMLGFEEGHGYTDRPAFEREGVEFEGYSTSEKCSTATRVYVQRSQRAFHFIFLVRCALRLRSYRVRAPMMLAVPMTVPVERTRQAPMKIPGSLSDKTRALLRRLPGLAMALTIAFNQITGELVKLDRTPLDREASTIQHIENFKPSHMMLATWASIQGNLDGSSTVAPFRPPMSGAVIAFSLPRYMISDLRTERSPYEMVFLDAEEHDDGDAPLYQAGDDRQARALDL